MFCLLKLIVDIIFNLRKSRMDLLVLLTLIVMDIFWDIMDIKSVSFEP